MHNHKGQRVTMVEVLRNRPNKGRLRNSSAIVTLYSLPIFSPINCYRTDVSILIKFSKAVIYCLFHWKCPERNADTYLEFSVSDGYDTAQETEEWSCQTKCHFCRGMEILTTQNWLTLRLAFFLGTNQMFEFNSNESLSSPSNRSKEPNSWPNNSKFTLFRGNNRPSQNTIKWLRNRVLCLFSHL